MIRTWLVTAALFALAGCSADTVASSPHDTRATGYDGAVFYAPEWPADASGNSPGVAPSADAAIGPARTDASTVTVTVSDAAAGASLDAAATLVADVTVTCVDDATCGADHYCQRASGMCRDEGVCVLSPRVCDDAYQPVCGCDGVTYANACDAAMHGRTVARSGACGT